MIIILMLLAYLFFVAFFLIKGKNWVSRFKKIPYNRVFQYVFVVIYLILACIPILSAIKHFGGIHYIIQRAGNLWLGVFIFASIFGLCAILIRKGQEKFGHKYAPIKHKPWQTIVMGVSVIVISGIFIGFGYYNAHNVESCKYDIECLTKSSQTENMKIAFISDLHIGGQVGYEHIEKVVNTINKMDADVVLIGGDIFDNDYWTIKNSEDIAELFKSIKSKYGVYGVYGNHDVEEKLIGGVAISSPSKAIRPAEMEAFLQKCNVRMLQDETITIAKGRINLIGRVDYQKPGDGSKNKKSLRKLCKNVKENRPTILLEHEPVELEEADRLGINLSLSGHTHRGQMFPITLTNNIIWENVYGVKKFGDMYSIVSSGAGFYGPPLRIGSKSEVVEVNVKFIPR